MPQRIGQMTYGWKTSIRIKNASNVALLSTDRSVKFRAWKQEQKIIINYMQ